jgi:hypothetical protein
MDAAYGEIYERLFNDAYREAEFPGIRVKTVIEHVDASLSASHGVHLRSDAKYMLLVNFADIVVRPILLHDAESAYTVDDMKDDVHLLATKAVNLRASDGDVSAHQMIDALSKNWNELKLTKVQLWGA